VVFPHPHNFSGFEAFERNICLSLRQCGFLKQCTPFMNYIYIEI